MLEAIAGGAIGAVITLAVGLAVWLWRARGDVTSHDRLIADRDDDLATWVADEQVWLDRALRRIDDLLAARGILDSGERPWQRGMAAEDALHRWRDQEREARRLVADLRGRESWPHRRWRGRRPFPALRTPDEARPVLGQWRSLAIDDPTSRTLSAPVGKLDEPSAAFAAVRRLSGS
jgi:hypothetical protein